MQKVIVIAAVGALLLQGCSWVRLTPEGENIRLLDRDQVAACTHLGTTTATLKDTVAGFRRNDEKVRRELATLARNAASELGGDTIVPATEPEGGRQTFDVYHCMP
ncbi:MAG: DUF4156 domain-containing protein [Gammaproteobacteria bacterium]|jgi:hypothetical protein|nr:DUF4156 domain-containing protein [Gammaproteobacteria bacterium]